MAPVVVEAPAAAAQSAKAFSFNELVDLTHTLAVDFPTFEGVQQLGWKRW
ncbi:MAG: hypothetical protein R2838_08155 [Caldilineaceae bacterium]